MNPIKHDISIFRGSSFEQEYVSQVKKYLYNPSVNNTKADLIRTHAENLKYHGFEYEYVDFETNYVKAELIFNKSWIKSTQQASTPLLVLSIDEGSIALTNRSVVVRISADTTKTIDFDFATIELLLTTDEGKVDKLIYGEATILGNR